MRISDWSSDVCSSDLFLGHIRPLFPGSTMVKRLSISARERLSLTAANGYGRTVRRWGRYGHEGLSGRGHGGGAVLDGRGMGRACEAGALLGFAAAGGGAHARRPQPGLPVQLGLSPPRPAGAGGIGRASGRERVWPYV